MAVNWRQWQTKDKTLQMFALKRAQYIATNAFLLFHIVGIVCWCIPVRSPSLVLCKSLVKPYFRWSGLFQSWDMFAPAPRSTNSYVEATIIHQDGSRNTWTFPRMEHLSLTERCFEERYRKFEESLQSDDNDALWPDVARQIARLNSSPSNPAKTVILIQKWSFIVPSTDNPYVPQPWDQHMLYGYGVRHEDLR